MKKKANKRVFGCCYIHLQTVEPALIICLSFVNFTAFVCGCRETTRCGLIQQRYFQMRIIFTFADVSFLCRQSCERKCLGVISCDQLVLHLHYEEERTNIKQLPGVW